MSLGEVIRSEIARGGPLPFARFMELSLYHPQHGYYETAAGRLGRRGDYYTSVSVGRLFGELLGFEFAAWLGPRTQGALQLVEGGAHDGRLAADVLAWFRDYRPELWERLEYWILEPSPRRQVWQRETLRAFRGRVHWRDDWLALAATGVTGIIFANELLDALPVHRWGWDARARHWFEWGVTTAGERFVWTRLDASRQRARAPAGAGWPEALLAVLPDGFTVETCPAAQAWWSHAASALRGGRLLTFDYGLTDEECLRPERSAGTLRAYRGQRLAPDPLAAPGEQDLTAHVRFTPLLEAGKAAGLRTETFCSQAEFFTRLLPEVTRENGRFAPWTPARVRQFHALTHPEHLGRAFRVLAQAR